MEKVALWDKGSSFGTKAVTAYITPLVFVPIFVAVFAFIFIGCLVLMNAVGLSFLYAVGFDPIGDLMRANGM